MTMTPAKILTAATPIFAISAFFVSLGNYPLLDNNEGLYASIASEMRRSGEYVIPHFNGLPYLEKPPLLFWLTALSFALQGTDEFAARTVPALASLTVVTGAVFFGHRASRPLAGAIAGIVLSTAAIMMVIGRTAYFDMLLSACLSWTLISAYFGITEKRRAWMYACAVALALGTLAKGFVAVIVSGATIALFLIATRAPARSWRALFDPRVIAVYLAIATPWHIAASFARPEWTEFYLYNEHIGRFLGAREPRDYYSGPFWYYLPRVFAYLAPWTIILPVLIVRRRSVPNEAADAWSIFLWCWFASSLAIFTAAGNKANYYMIVTAVPLALLIAQRISLWFEIVRTRYIWGLAAGAAAIVIGGLAGIDVTCSPNLGELYPYCGEIAPPTYAPMAALCAGFALAAYRWRNASWRPLLPLLLVATLSIPLRDVMVDAASHFEDRLCPNARWRPV